MKKTIWIPIVIGLAFGLISGITFATNLSFTIIGEGGAKSGVGFYTIFWLLAAAFGGPLAGVISGVVGILIAGFFGIPEIKAVVSDVVTLWSNVIAFGCIALPIVSLIYRLIFERLKMPLRLLAWAGCVIIGYYAVGLVVNMILQFLFRDFSPTSKAMFAAFDNQWWQVLPVFFRSFLPQIVADIIITSLTFLGLPERYRRPLWYERKKKSAEGQA